MREIFKRFPMEEAVLWWIGISSVVLFFFFLASIFLIIARIPSDHFTRERPRSEARSLLGWVAVILKNLVGIAFVLLGLLLLVLPGQGILTILVGLMLVDFPGKHSLERWIIQRPNVQRVINRIRERAGRPPLEIPSGSED